MHLIMFDLDGTLVDSTNIDSECYLQALVDVFGFDLDKIDRNWGSSWRFISNWCEAHFSALSKFT
jgi:beta-phosphoglucomutase-like phosphatase (HAD superfamily)